MTQSQHPTPVLTAISPRANAIMFFESFLINVAVLLVLILALTFDYVSKFFSYWYIREIPNKTPVPFFGTDYHRVLGLRNTTEEVNRLYGDHVKEKYVGCIKSRMPELIVKEPESVQKILSSDFANFHCRGYGLDRSRDVCLRNNLFYADGEKWTLLRRKFELLLNSIDVKIEDSLHDCLSGTNGDANVQQLLSSILDVLFKDLLIDNNLEDTSVIKDVREAMQRRTLLDKLRSYTINIFPSIYVMLRLNVLPEQYYGKYAQIIKESKLMRDIEKTESISREEEIHNDKTHKKGSDLETAYSYLSLFINEGYVPCHYVLTALLFELARNPDAQQKARRCAPSSDENDYLNMTVKEALRLYPAHSVIARKCVRTYTFPGKSLLLDKGVTICVPVEAIHRDERHYERAEEFNPERFSENSDESFTYLPFGAGPRKCAGEQLAMRIIRSVTANILKKYRIEIGDSTPRKLQVTDHHFLRVVDNDVWLRFQPI